MNRLVDEFRNGRDTVQLLVALDSDEDEIVSLAAWVLAELPVGRYDDGELLDRLRGLTGHPDPAVRFHAVMALFPSLGADALFTQDLLDRLVQDPSEAVRKVAHAARGRLLDSE